MDFGQPFASQRSPVLGRNVVATSQPLAAQAGLSMLARGGNAVDAAIATAMALTVVEPTGNGLGSDAFAMVWDGARLHGLNASGRSPAGWSTKRFTGADTMPWRGWDSVTVPGAISGWMALHERFGSLPLEVIAAPAIALARDGFPVSPIIARLWALGFAALGDQPGFAEAFAPEGRPPKAGEYFRFPALAESLEAIVETRGEAFYRGALARQIITHAREHGGALTEADLGEHQADWVDTIAMPFAGAEVHELPPNGQGITTLATLGMLETLGIGPGAEDDLVTTHLAIEATKLALADTLAFVADPDAMMVAAASMIDRDYLQDRARLIDPHRAGDPGHGTPKRAGTVYLATADAAGRMVSFIQSNYMGFGSGVVVPGTGISLQNRGAGFTLKPGHPNSVGPRKRPFHTIIPGFALDGSGQALTAFGVMGGPMQAQGHTQMMLRLLAFGQNPQTAADAPRWRVEQGRKVAVEATMRPELIEGLRMLGHDVMVEPPDAVFAFGGTQIIQRHGEGYVAGSDPRKDGQAVAF
jgi:gamma-glutamyltranspeptidase / glutathione hydrolase